MRVIKRIKKRGMPVAEREDGHVARTIQTKERRRDGMGWMNEKWGGEGEGRKKRWKKGRREGGGRDNHITLPQTIP